MSDISKSKQIYYSGDFNAKKGYVLLLLDTYKGYGEIFSNMLDYINISDDVTELDLDEVFEVIFGVISEYLDDKKKEASDKLKIINEKMLLLREKEMIERQSENLDEMLNETFKNI